VHELVTRRIIGVAMDVHRELGPGLLESIYEECLCLALQQAGHAVERQRIIPVESGGHRVSVGLRLDIVDNAVVIEVKSIEALMPIHEAQLLTYPQDRRVPGGAPAELQRHAPRRRHAPAGPMTPRGTPPLLLRALRGTSVTSVVNRPFHRAGIAASWNGLFDRA
jgi:GxxExxY protein